MLDQPRKPLVKPANKLTEKQQAFAREYVKDFNGTRSAKAAGYSERTAPQIAIGLLNKSSVLARIIELQSERRARVQVDADWVLVRLLAELEADAKDLYGPDGELLPVAEWPEVWRKGMVTGIRSTEIRGGDNGQTVIGHTKDVVFADRVKRIELLGRHINVQAFKERLSLGVDDPLKVLFGQIMGQSVRPKPENAGKTIEHQPEIAPPTPGMPLGRRVSGT